MTHPAAILLVPATIKAGDIGAIIIALLLGAYLIYILLTAERL